MRARRPRRARDEEATLRHTAISPPPEGSATPSCSGFDPLLPLKESAHYLGFRGKDPVKSLRRLNIERHPMPGTGLARPRFGHRLSTLNAYLDSLADAHSRVHIRRRNR